ncbi:MAG: hypothetical protein HY332_14815 [Chloroflexi bacterium]|nr:hypothetical protein [Chloroflexota bacterium]
MLEAMEDDAELTERQERDTARWLAFVEDLFPELLSSRRAVAFDRLENAYAHLQATLAWLVQREDVERAARLVRVLREFWGSRGRVTEGQRWIARILALPGAAAPSAARATLLDHAGALACYADDPSAARKLLQECLTIRRALGLTTLLPVTLSHLATVVRAANHDDATARGLYEESLALAREQGNTYIVRGTLYRLARLDIDQGDYDAARRSLEENVALARATGTDYLLGLVLRTFAAIAAHLGQPERALRLASAGKAHHEAAGITFGPPEEAWFDRWLRPARRALDEAAQAAAWKAGSGLALEQALAEALAM